MTHIIEQDQPKVNHLLIRKAIQKGDTVIFQLTTPGLEGRSVTEEHPVKITNVQTEPGLMKGWCIISWEA